MDNKTAAQAALTPRHSLDRGMELRWYVNLIKNERYSIVGLALILSILAGFIVFSINPVYTSKVVIMIESQETKVTSIEEMYELETTKNEYFFTQYEILKSRELARRIVEQFNLTEVDEFRRFGILIQPVLFHWRIRLSENLGRRLLLSEELGRPKNQIREWGPRGTLAEIRAIRGFPQQPYQGFAQSDYCLMEIAVSCNSK